MRRGFATLDVFTNRRFAGNPLAVVLDAEGLDAAAMQAIAREFNLSETVFVLPPEDAAHRGHLRIFTPVSELPFAGHPTVGTAVLLALMDAIESEQAMVLGEALAPVHCVVAPSRGGVGHARFTVPRLPQFTGETSAPSALAAALSLDAADIGCAPYRPGRWSAGLPVTMVPLAGLAAMRRARADLSHWEAAFGAGPHAAFMFCRETDEAGHAFHARMFAPTLGMAEDPATGSAVAALAGLIARDGDFSDGTHDFAVEQGYEMGRPSILHLRIGLRGGVLESASIGGDAVLVSEGTIEA